MRNLITIFTIAVIILTTFNLKTIAQVADSTQRLVKVAGAVNFRDVGGYKTEDGRQVKWGKVYRSAALNKLTDSDLDTLRHRKINTVIDFRSTSERSQGRDHLPPNIDYQFCPQGSEHLDSWADILPKLTTADSLMTSLYNNPDSVAARNKVFFTKLLQLPNDSALLFHCTSGKDRTGMAAALFLYALNVPMKTIMADYMASNVYRKTENERTIEAIMAYLKVDKQVAEDLVIVKPKYLKATFSAINKKYGSVENFLAQAMGIGPEQLKVLRNKYTQ